MDKRAIGVFDSGVGGIAVFKEIIENNPNENIIYLGDTKRFPYGNKSKESIIELTKNGIEFLMQKDVKEIIIACGTATSQALEEVRKIYNIPIIGIIEATVKYVKKENIKNIGVMATVGTIRSDAWRKSILKEVPEAKIINKACALLAPMAEEGWIDNKIAQLTIREYLKEINKENEIEAVILGCTHYPLFKNIIKKELRSNVKIIDTGEILSKELREELTKNGMQNEENKPEYKIFLTDIETNFKNVATKLLQKEDIIKNIELAKI